MWMTKQELDDKLAQVRQEWRDGIAERLRTTTDSYDKIARDAGTTGGTVYELARKYGLRSKADGRKEVANG